MKDTKVNLASKQKARQIDVLSEVGFIVKSQFSVQKHTLDFFIIDCIKFFVKLSITIFLIKFNVHLYIFKFN